MTTTTATLTLERRMFRAVALFNLFCFIVSLVAQDLGSATVAIILAALFWCAAGATIEVTATKPYGVD
jgi:hypothetical protein